MRSHGVDRYPAWRYLEKIIWGADGNLPIPMRSLITGRARTPPWRSETPFPLVDVYEAMVPPEFRGDRQPTSNLNYLRHAEIRTKNLN